MAGNLNHNIVHDVADALGAVGHADVTRGDGRLVLLAGHPDVAVQLLVRGLRPGLGLLQRFLRGDASAMMEDRERERSPIVLRLGFFLLLSPSCRERVSFFGFGLSEGLRVHTSQGN